MVSGITKPYTDVNYWFPCEYRRGPNALVWVALICCFITVLIKLSVPSSVSRWSEAIATLLFLYPLITQWPLLKKNIWIKLWGLAIVCPFLFFLINYLQNPVVAIKYASFDKLPRIYLFIPIAWWLGGNKKTISIFLLLSMIGFFIAVTTSQEFSNDLAKALNGQRVKFSINGLNWQQASLFFSLCLIGCITHLKPTISKKKAEHKVLKIIFLALCTLASLLGIIATQTRAAYLGLLICLLVLLVTNGFKLIRYHRKTITNKTLIIAALVLLTLSIPAAILINPITKNVTNRVINESNTLTAVVNRDWSNIPYNSIGIRLNTWIVAAPWIKESPLIGHGGKVRTHVIQQSGLPNEVKKNIGHFHNNIIEFMLSYGLIGTLIALTPLLYILAMPFFTKKMSFLDEFSFYGAILFFIMGMFESYLFFWTGPFILTLLANRPWDNITNESIKE